MPDLRLVLRGGPLWLAALWLACCSTRQPPRPVHPGLDGSDERGVVSPATDTERAVLERLGSLAPGQREQVRGVAVVAEPAYAAASGRSCRRLALGPSGGNASEARLACSEGKGWFFVPNVFASPAEGSP
jgi:hypothetical protein